MMLLVRILPLFLFAISMAGCETEDLNFPTDQLVDDRDGQIYQSVKIGEQWWLSENLNFYTSWGSWYYDNDSLAYSEDYGRLYYWQTMMGGSASSSLNPSGIKGVCPEGWHVPSDAEWSQLESFLANNDLSAADLKKVGLAYWGPDNTCTNLTGFSAVPAGTAWNNGNNFAFRGGYAVFLSSTIDPSTSGVWGRVLYYDSLSIVRHPMGTTGAWSVRCVKD